MIEVRSLTKRYGTTIAVDGLSFDVRPGAVTGFLGPNGSGKSTTMRIAEFTDALARVAAGGTALDPEVVTQLAGAGSRPQELGSLTDRERAVISLMAEGRSNAGIAQALVVSAGTVEKHVASIFGKLGLPPSEDDNRRVPAVLRFLRT
ncbi:LuxR C-terminal-related transcriptional regulator [Streptomyces sp. NPDC056437]|uniref:response regulator transcription factor n=1 Tax=Streptomyces sp. NPDC056437 TaxID=3345816 RepID=UPI0036D13D15